MEDEMIDKLNALDKLIEAVEAGGIIEMTDVRRVIKDRDDRVNFHKAREGSLDAALALHEALLPGCYATLTSVGEATIFGNVSTRGTTWAELSDAEAITPARAWLLAILRAYRSVQA